MNDPDVFAPNLNRRQSGVSATVFSLVPLQEKQIAIAATGVALPDGLAQIPLWKIPFLTRRQRVWHARRNNEMIVGLLLKHLFRSRLKLVFTSSSPRKRGGLTRWLVARMDAIVATNAVNASVMPSCTAIIPHGVDTNAFQTGHSAIFGATEQKLIGCFGRVRQKKGTHTFVDAMCDLLPQFPEYSAVIMGRIQDADTYGADLAARIKAAGLESRITFEAEQPIAQMPKAYQSLDIYVAPSLLEGFGLTPLEAMSCGVPTVASRDVGSFNDQIVEGKTGFLFPKENANALTDALRNLMSSPELTDQMRSAARAHVVQNFSLDQEADALVGLYRRLLASS